MIKMHIHVAGVPVTQGSKRLVRGRMIEDAGPKLARWRTAIGWAARAAMHGALPIPLEQPVKVELVFRFARPAKPSRSYPCSGGGLDIEKLVRAAHDAMTGIVWTDDSQCVDVRATKEYGAPGVEIAVMW